MSCPNVRGDTTQYCILNCQHDALRPPCPTCGGTRYKSAAVYVRADDSDPSCPDCVDGKVSIEQLAATWQAVWDEKQPELTAVSTLYGSGWLDCIDRLREVRP